MNSSAKATAAIVLAAGASSRLGQPKQLALLGSETLLERAVRVAAEAGCSPVIVVLGANAERIQDACRLGDAVIVRNAAWREGMASSIRTGVGALASQTSPSEGVVLMTCDQPAVTASHLRILMQNGVTTASEYAGRKGVPAYFCPDDVSALELLAGDRGAQGLLAHARAIPLPDGAWDIDTPEALEAARIRFR